LFYSELSRDKRAERAIFENEPKLTADWLNPGIHEQPSRTVADAGNSEYKPSRARRNQFTSSNKLDGVKYTSSQAK